MAPFVDSCGACCRPDVCGDCFRYRWDCGFRDRCSGVAVRMALSSGTGPEGCFGSFRMKCMKGKDTQDTSYRDYRREVNIVDFSWGMQCRELRRQRRERLRKRFLRWLSFVLLGLLLWLLGR